MISLVMAVMDNLEWTRKGVESILNHTESSFELILIDNGSEEETQVYLQSLGDLVTVLRNDVNQGCAKAWNQGIAASKGDYICIVNNDIEVPHSWLRHLQEFYENHDFALISPAMREGVLDYNLEEYQQFFSKVFHERYFMDEFRGIALFATRSLYKRLNGFDENFELGKFEDEDFFMRLKKKGLKTAVFTGVVIHHYGSKTINQVKQRCSFDFEEKNREVFWVKWRHRYLWRKWRKVRLKCRHKLVLWRYGLQY